MARDKITEYSSTASENTVVGDVNLAENSMNPSDVNNALREVLSHQKEAFGSGTPLYVDQTNNRVGIGTTPSAKLSLPAQASGDSGVARLAIESAVDFDTVETLKRRPLCTGYHETRRPNLVFIGCVTRSTTRLSLLLRTHFLPSLHLT